MISAEDIPALTSIEIRLQVFIHGISFSMDLLSAPNDDDESSNPVSSSEFGMHRF